MKKEAIKFVKKTAKTACVLGVAAGAVALMTSKTALKMLLDGQTYVKDALKKFSGKQEHEEPLEEAAEVSTDEAFAAESDFAEE